MPDRAETPHINEATVARLAGGELRADELLPLELHLDACEVCRALVGAVLHAAPSACATGPGTGAETSTVRGAAPRPGPFLRRGSSVGRYVVIDVLGMGGMGVVYLAFDPMLDRNVALKLTRSSASSSEQLRREAQAMARLAHPNVVNVFDVGDFEGRIFIAMEYVKGRTLRSWLRETPRSWQELLRVFTEAGRALAAAHRAGITHGDFKSDNVLVGEDGRARVADFGLTRFGDEKPLFVGGTPTYMAPEQKEGGAGTALTDQFNFCAAFLEVLRGNPGGRMATVKGVPSRMRQALERGIKQDPGARHPSMDALLRALAPAHRRWPARVGLASAVLVAIGLTFALMASREARRLEACIGERRLASVWGPDLRAKAEAQLRPLTSAGLNIGSVFATFDEFSKRWLQAREQLCLHQMTDAGAEAYRASYCLDRSLESFAAATSLMNDASLAESAIDELPSLGNPVDCLQAPKSEPEAAADEQRTRLLALSGNIARAQALLSFDRVDDAERLTQQLLEEAERLGPSSLQSEIVLLQSLAQGARGMANRRTYLSVVEAGARTGNLLVQAQGWRELAYWHIGRVEPDLAEEALAQATALNAQLQDASLEGQLLLARSQVALHNRSDAATAKTHLEQAATILGATYGPENMSVVRIQWALAPVISVLGDEKRATELLETSLKTAEKILGANHSELGPALILLARQRLAENRADEALALATRARQLYERLPKSRVEHAYPYETEGFALIALNRGEEALASFTEAENLYAKVVGAENPYTTRQVLFRSRVLHMLGRNQQALALARTAIASFQKTSGMKWFDAAMSPCDEGNALLALGRTGAAKRSYGRCIQLLEATLGPGDAMVAEGLRGMAEAELRERRPGKAIPYLERCLMLLKGAYVDPADLGRVHFRMAQALWARRGVRGKALSHARQALETLSKAPRAGALRAETEAWLESRERTRPRAGRGSKAVRL